MRPFKKGLGEPQCVLGFQTLPNHTSSLPESEAREERTLGVGGGSEKAVLLYHYNQSEKRFQIETEWFLKLPREMSDRGSLEKMVLGIGTPE